MEVHVDGLLHLGALVTATTVVYVGIDRINSDRDQFAASLETIRGNIRDYISTEFDIDYNSDQVIDNSYQIYAVLVLCYIAYARARGRLWTWPLHFYYRQRHVFLYRYFSGRNDIRVMGCGCLFSLITFLYLVLLQVYGADLEANTKLPIPYSYSSKPFELIFTTLNCLHLLFWAYSLLVLFAFASVLISAPLKPHRLQKKCDQLMQLARAQRDAYRKRSLRAALKFSPRGANGAVPPGEATGGDDA
jgi:hypothetical protein